MRLQNHRLSGIRCACLAGVLFAAVGTGTAQDTPPDLPPAITAAFDARDTDGNGSLSSEEFVAGGGRQPDVLRRDFALIDLDADGAMSRQEFLNVPYVVPREHRGRLPDPVVDLLTRDVEAVDRQWSEWDRDANGSLSQDEFEAADPLRSLPGLETTGFADWDRDADGAISRDDVRLLLDIAWGIRRPEGQLLRTADGFALDWRTFRALDRDDDGFIDRDRYIASRSSLGEEKAAEQFQQIDANSDDRIAFEEWVILPDLWRDQLTLFMRLDTDLSGRINRDELVNAALAPGQKRFAPGSLPGFDTDGDGELSFLELRLTPVANLLAIWNQARDEDSDGRLSRDEFRFIDRPALAAICAMMFTHLDQNGDEFLQLSEWPFLTSHPIATYSARDTDSDGRLTKDEFVQAGARGRDSETLARDFGVLDLDADESLSFDEYLTVPYLVPREHQGSLPDPVLALVEESMAEIERQWSSWDGDENGELSRGEFVSSRMNRSLRGLELTGFSDWDADRDGQVGRADTRRLLEIAFGVRRPQGELVRTPSGSVIDWRSFKALDRDDDGAIDQEEYLNSGAARGLADPEARFREIDADGDGRARFEEWAASPSHWASAVGRFLRLDGNLDGAVDPDELQAADLPAGQKPMAPHLLPAFDADGDAVLSLTEYQLTPLANLLTNWIAARDTDHDGRLSAVEFRFEEGPSLAALSSEYFTRLDVDGDGYLDLDDWPFQIDVARAPRAIVFRLRDTDEDGQLSFDEILGNLKRPEPGEPYNPGQEAKLVWIEEAFRRADADGDESLDLAEFNTNDGLQTIAPGAAAMDRQRIRDRGLKDVMTTEGPDVRTWLIVGFNVLLIVMVVTYVILKTKRAS